MDKTRACDNLKSSIGIHSTKFF